MKIDDLPNPDLTSRLLQDEDLHQAAVLSQSSHWRDMHSKTVAAESLTSQNGKLELALDGHGFGNLRSCHPLQLPFEWITSIAYAARFDRKAELWREFSALRTAIGRLPRSLRLKMTYDMLRQLFAWHTLSCHLPRRRPRRYCMIGDGFGVLSALIKELEPDAKMTLVDLPKTLVFQSVYVQLMHPARRHGLFGEADSDKDFAYCPAPALPEPGEYDVFININSMQEMPTEAIASYFNFIRRNASPDHVFYCCNRLEKKLSGGEVVRYREYPWKDQDHLLLDETCRYQKYILYMKTWPEGPKFLGRRIPFVNAFDGETWHRVVRLKRARSEMERG